MKKRLRRPPREGMAMLIVMLLILTSTSLALYGIHSTSIEMRSAGFARQAMQTDQVAESGLTATLALIDLLGPQSVLFAIESGGAPTMYAPEPALAEGKTGYRFYNDDFSYYFTGDQIPVPTDFYGPKNAFQSEFVVDMNDHYTYIGVVPGSRSDGYGNMRFMHATYTARGRAQVAGGDVVSTGDTRQFNETASNARAFALTGPFAR